MVLFNKYNNMKCIFFETAHYLLKAGNKVFGNQNDFDLNFQCVRILVTTEWPCCAAVIGLYSLLQSALVLRISLCVVFIFLYFPLQSTTLLPTTLLHRESASQILCFYVKLTVLTKMYFYAYDNPKAHDGSFRVNSPKNTM